MKLDNLKKELGTSVVQRAQLELGVTRKINGKKVRRVASDKLRKSLTYIVNGRKINFVTGVPYGKFIHEGVNGTNQNWGSEYSFGSKQPPLDPIKRWMKQKGVRVRKKGGGFAKQTEANVNGLAYAISKGVKIKGIAPVPFYSLAISNIFQTQSNLVDEALRKDIELIIDLEWQ